MRILVSACLLGTACRYDGKSAPKKHITELLDKHDLIPVCPEIFGGLPTPRSPSEIKDGRVITKMGKDVTEEYRKGAEEALKIAVLYGCKYAILKEKSPSCGSGRIYDGTFSGCLTDGYGITAELLMKNGIKVFGESDIEELLNLED